MAAKSSMVGCAVPEHHCAGHDAGHNIIAAGEAVFGPLSPGTGLRDDWTKSSERALETRRRRPKGSWADRIMMNSIVVAKVTYFRLCSMYSSRKAGCANSTYYRARGDVPIPSGARSARAGPNVKATLRGARFRPRTLARNR